MTPKINLLLLFFLVGVAKKRPHIPVWHRLINQTLEITLGYTTLLRDAFWDASSSILGILKGFSYRSVLWDRKCFRIKIRLAVCTRSSPDSQMFGQYLPAGRISNMEDSREPHGYRRDSQRILCKHSVMVCVCVCVCEYNAAVPSAECYPPPGRRSIYLQTNNAPISIFTNELAE